MTLAEKLLNIYKTKEQIRQAIIDKGIVVDESVLFADYSVKIGQIEVGTATGTGNDILRGVALDVVTSSVMSEMQIYDSVQFEVIGDFIIETVVSDTLSTVPNIARVSHLSKLNTIIP